MKNIYIQIIFASVLVISTAVQAMPVSLYGTQLLTQVQYQQTAQTDRLALSFSDTSIVGSAIEISNLADLQIASNPFNLGVVPVSVDVGQNYIQLDYGQAVAGAFASGFFNGYKFSFDSTIPVSILSATVNPSSTLVGLDDNRLTFEGNNLFVNVASLSFQPTSIFRIDLTAISTEVPPEASIPLPATTWMMLLGLVCLGTVRSRAGGRK